MLRYTCENIEINGYSNSVIETKKPKEGPSQTLATKMDRTIAEYYTGPFDHSFEPKSEGSLKLEIKDTPYIARPPVSEWVNVLDFQDKIVAGDWAPAIQAAIDTGKQLIYFPPEGRYQIASDVVIRGNVTTFFGGSPKTMIDNGNKDNPQDGPAIVLSGEVQAFQFDLLGSSHIKHESATTLVFRHCSTGHISAGPKCGELYIEDAGG